MVIHTFFTPTYSHKGKGIESSSSICGSTPPRTSTHIPFFGILEASCIYINIRIYFPRITIATRGKKLVTKIKQKKIITVILTSQNFRGGKMDCVRLASPPNSLFGGSGWGSQPTNPFWPTPPWFFFKKKYFLMLFFNFWVGFD